MFTFSGATSVLDLSSLQSIDSSFNAGTYSTEVNTITASSGGTLDLSSVTAITAPVLGNDRLDIRVSDTAEIDLSSLATISGGGQTRFVVTDGATQLLPKLQTVSRGRFDVSGGASAGQSGRFGLDLYKPSEQCPDVHRLGCDLGPGSVVATEY